MTGRDHLSLTGGEEQRKKQGRGGSSRLPTVASDGQNETPTGCSSFGWRWRRRDRGSTGMRVHNGGWMVFSRRRRENRLGVSSGWSERNRGGRAAMAGNGKMVVVSVLHGDELAEPRWGMGKKRSGTQRDAIKTGENPPKSEIEVKVARSDLGKKEAARGILAERQRPRQRRLGQQREEDEANGVHPMAALFVVRGDV